MADIDGIEDAVTLEVKIDGYQNVAALFDSGANPSILDKETLRRLGLMDKLTVNPSKVFRL